MKKFSIIASAALLCAVNLCAQTDYKASPFGCMSDGITLNTQSIQTAINTISRRGGGMLHFYVGRYLTGTVFLKDNVTIVLHEGATLVGVPSIYDYDAPSDGPKGLIVAEGQKNVGVIGSTAEYGFDSNVVGKGIVQGQGALVVESAETQTEKGYLEEGTEQALPALISFSGCTGVRVSGLMLRDAASGVVTLTNCKEADLCGLLIDSRQTAESDGITLDRCENVRVADNFVNVSGKSIRTDGAKSLKTSNNKTPKGKL